jgi:hypothetical protein
VARQSQRELEKTETETERKSAPGGSGGGRPRAARRLAEQLSPPAKSFRVLQAVFSASGERQLRADQELKNPMPWNLHFLACLPHTLEAPLLAGARAANFKPPLSAFLLSRAVRRQFRVGTKPASSSRPSLPRLRALHTNTTRTENSPGIIPRG